MFKFVLLVFLTTSLAWSSPKEFRSEQKVAVLVGISQYDESITGVRPLKYAANDMNVLKKTLEDQNYTVITLLNSQASKAVILHKIKQLKEFMKQGEGTLLFAFSGHGFSPDGKETSMVAHDTIVQNLKETGLSVPELIKAIRAVNPKKAVLFLDACRNDPSPGAKSIAKSGFVNLNPGQGIQILYSTKQNHLSFEEPEFKQGIFSYFLNKGLKGEAFRNNSITFRSLSDYVEHEVSKWTLLKKANVQKPFRNTAGDVAGSFVLAVKGAADDQPKDLIVTPVNDIINLKHGMALKRVPPGSFMMGSTKGQSDELPLRRVKIGYPFWMSTTEVTFDQYDEFTKATGSISPNDRGWGRTNRPVINVSWNEAKSYSDWLTANNSKGLVCRLPSESEWEYAARAGTQSEYSWGNEINHDLANYGADKCCTGFKQGADLWLNETAPVASFKANSFGLYDMHGNVWEWVQDKWSKNYSGSPNNGDALEAGDTNRRVFRGGSWLNFPANLRSADRSPSPEDVVDFRNFSVGFRIVCRR